MQIIRDELYLSKLNEAIDYLASKSVVAAINFLNKLDRKINDLPNMPFKFRQSIYYKNENIRDLIFKGYTIPYLVDEEKELIVVLKKKGVGHSFALDSVSSTE